VIAADGERRADLAAPSQATVVACFSGLPSPLALSGGLWGVRASAAA